MLVPVLAVVGFVGWELAQGRFGWGDTLVLLIATLFGTAFALLAINWLLAPVAESTRALDTLGEGERPVLAECDSRDLMGVLVASVNRAATGGKAVATATVVIAVATVAVVAIVVPVATVAPVAMAAARATMTAPAPGCPTS